MLAKEEAHFLRGWIEVPEHLLNMIKPGVGFVIVSSPNEAAHAVEAKKLLGRKSYSDALKAQQLSTASSSAPSGGAPRCPAGGVFHTPSSGTPRAPSVGASRAPPGGTSHAPPGGASRGPPGGASRGPPGGASRAPPGGVSHVAETLVKPGDPVDSRVQTRSQDDDDFSVSGTLPDIEPSPDPDVTVHRGR
ncbi:uncharacterized protein LOC135202483 [Macrobrachium nipponense]|uniref:uncharacterized protein LOC135202483 n=1 Tax=Macrobrachium nipponense TaxID=159736 RepID=UPI0030C883C9